MDLETLLELPENSVLWLFTVSSVLASGYSLALLSCLLDVERPEGLRAQGILSVYGLGGHFPAIFWLLLVGRGARSPGFCLLFVFLDWPSVFCN